MKRKFMLATVIAPIVIQATLSAALAQPPAFEPPKKYPWDMRPNKCFTPAGVVDNPMCVAEPDWPSFSVAKTRIDNLFIIPDFDLIRRAENDLGFSTQRFPTGEYYFEAWDLSLQSAFQFQADRGTKIAGDWARSKGRDGYVPLIEAIVHYGQAWAARGNGFTVSKEAAEIYYEYLERADGDLETASARLRKTGPWHLWKLRIALQHPELRKKALELLKSASEDLPDYVELYATTMNFLQPSWGGSFEVMDGVARFAVEKTKAQLGSGMYALAYERLFRTHHANFPLRAAADWPLLKQGFRDLQMKGYPQPWMWARFAALACDMRDRHEARRLYLLYDRSRDPREKQSESPDPCRRYAESS